MKENKMKVILLGLFFAISLGLKAQEDKSYEYASVVYASRSSKQAVVSVSTEGNYSETIVNLTEGNVLLNLNPVIETTNKLSKEGWVVYGNSTSTIQAGSIVYYFLKRKK